MPRTVDPAAAVNPLEGLDADPALITRAIRNHYAQGRESLTTFFELVIREEQTQQALTTAPHQALLYSFMYAHRRCVIRQPIYSGKTFSAATFLLWLLGRDATARNMIVSNTQAQAKKILGMIKDYITEDSLNGPLHMVFPKLRRSPREGDAWTTERIAIDRPAAIRDPSVHAVGVGTTIEGARITNIVCDDLINNQNSATPEQRTALREQFESRFLSRLDVHKSRCVVTNTPWNREDLTYELESRGWPTLTMDIYGFVRTSNANAVWLRQALDAHLRPARTRTGKLHDWYRLRAHDPDPEEVTTLWPEIYPRARVDALREEYTPHEFARLLLCEPMSLEDSKCQRGWIEKCKVDGMGQTLVSEYRGPNPTYTGLDLGIGQGRANDKTVFFTLELRPDQRKKILHIESGRWEGPEIVRRLVRIAEAFGSIVRVETNQAQAYLRQFAQQARKGLTIQAHTTTRANKQSQEFGVESVFTEIEQGMWIIPCDNSGRCHSEVQAWIDDCLFYQPHHHTGDYLMSSWLAREGARRVHRTDPRPTAGKRRFAARDWSTY